MHDGFLGGKIQLNVRIVIFAWGKFTSCRKRKAFQMHYKFKPSFPRRMFVQLGACLAFGLLGRLSVLLHLLFCLAVLLISPQMPSHSLRIACETIVGLQIINNGKPTKTFF